MPQQSAREQLLPCSPASVRADGYHGGDATRQVAAKALQLGPEAGSPTCPRALLLPTARMSKVTRNSSLDRKPMCTGWMDST